ncbi:MAG: hypothetical protein [Microvirus sp.]|nr:MAG: hypothetical protein [Microvirus sp.]
MAFRKKLSAKASKRSFTKHATKINAKNFRPPPKRGGYRL